MLYKSCTPEVHKCRLLGYLTGFIHVCGSSVCGTVCMWPLWRKHLEVSPRLLGNLCIPGVLFLVSLLSLVWHYYYYYYYYYHHHHHHFYYPCYRLCGGYLRLCTCNKPCFYCTQCHSCSVLQSVLHVMSCYFARVICSELPHQHFPQFVCSAVYDFCLLFLNSVLSRYVAHVLSEWFWNGSARPYYYRYHFSFHIPHALNFLYEVYIF